MLLTFENLSRILRLEPASQLQNLRAEPQKLERMTPRSISGRGLQPRQPAPPAYAPGLWGMFVLWRLSC